MRFSKPNVDNTDNPEEKRKGVISVVPLPRRVPTTLLERRVSLANPSTFASGIGKTLVKTKHSKSQDELLDGTTKKVIPKTSTSSANRKLHLERKDSNQIKSKRRVSWAGGFSSGNSTSGQMAGNSGSVIDVQVLTKKKSTLKKSKSIGSKQDMQKTGSVNVLTSQDGSTRKKEKRKHSKPKRNQR